MSDRGARAEQVRVLVALLRTSPITWTAAVMHEAGEIKVVQLPRLYMGAGSPLALAPVLSMFPESRDPVEILLVLGDGGPDDVELQVIMLQHAHLNSIRIIGVTTVTPATVLTHLGLPADTDITSSAGRTAFTEAINSTVGGTFDAEDFDAAFVVAMAAAGAAGPWSVPQIFEMLPAPKSQTPRPVTSTDDAAPPLARADQRVDPVLPDPACQTEPDLLTVDDLAAALQISRSAAYRLASRVPGARIPGVGLRFRRQDLEAFVEASKRRTVPPPKPKRPGLRHGMRVAGDDDVEILPGLTRRQLREKAGF